MEGSICAQDTMTVGAKGQVNGCVKGQLVQIAGRFEGEMWCQDLTIFPGVWCQVRCIASKWRSNLGAAF